jgi:hypothetical protein
MHKKLKLALLLFLIGFIGVLSMLSMYALAFDPPQSIFSDLNTLWNSGLNYLIFPTVNLLVAVVVGTLLYDKVNLKLPVLEGLIDKNQKIKSSGILQYGTIGGIISGVLITIIILTFAKILPPELIETIRNPKVSIITRIFHGAITGEILHRFGFMTFLVWLGFKLSGNLTPNTY